MLRHLSNFLFQKFLYLLEMKTTHTYMNLSQFQTTISLCYTKKSINEENVWYEFHIEKRKKGQWWENM